VNICEVSGLNRPELEDRTALKAVDSKVTGYAPGV
jgi:hypothetical protein